MVSSGLYTLALSHTSWASAMNMSRSWYCSVLSLCSVVEKSVQNSWRHRYFPSLERWNCLIWVLSSCSSAQVPSFPADLLDIPEKYMFSISSMPVQLRLELTKRVKIKKARLRFKPMSYSMITKELQPLHQMNDKYWCGRKNINTLAGLGESLLGKNYNISLFWHFSLTRDATYYKWG